MSPFNIYRKTMIFSWLKLGVGLMTLFICLGIGALAWFLITRLSFDAFTSIAIGCGAFLVAVVLYYLMMTKIGYSIKLGHLAIIERAHRGESIPSNPVEFSKTIVRERFGTNRQYYALSRNLMVTIRQLVRVISRGFSLDTDAPNMHSGRWVKHLICMPALRSIDECCLTYTLGQKPLEVNAACVDAMTLLVQNWAGFMSKAMRVSIVHILVCLFTFVLFFLPGFFICRDLGVNTMPWFGVAFFLTLTVKIAFFDSYVLTKIVCGFLTLAAESKIDPKNYAKLDKWSKGYDKMRHSAEKAADKAEREAEKAERAAKKAAKKAEEEEAKAAKKATAENANAEATSDAENASNAEAASDAENASNAETASDAEDKP